MKKKNPVGTVLIYLFLLLMSVLVIFPLYIMVAGSLKFPQDLAAHSWQLPSPATLNNFRRLLSYNAGTIVRTYANSLFITAAHTAIVILLGSLAAFAFSKYRFAGRRTLFVLLLATMMIPFELCATPLYIIFSKINWLNTYQIQIIPFTANVFAMYMMKQYMDGIPDALVEAARLDGAGHLRIWWSVMMPVTKPVISATVVLVALAKFNDYLWPKITITDEKYMPIMTILPTLNDKAAVFNVPRELLLTGCTIVIIPLLILFVFMQDAFMSSVTIGAVKE